MDNLRIKKYRRNLVIILMLTVAFFFIYVNNYYKKNIPDYIRINLNEIESINFGFKTGFINDSVDVTLDGESNIPRENLRISVNSTANFEAKEAGNYQVDLTLFGIFNVKTVNVDVVDKIEVIPCGFPVGIYLETDGVMVVGSGTVIGRDGIAYEPALNIIKTGDYIVGINGINVSSKSQLLYLVNKYGKEELTITLRRDDREMDVKVTPVKTEDNEYKIGVWVRDDTQGIGTLTYVTDENKFGALGHGISDIDTGELLACNNNGLLYGAKIWGIRKGIAGTPGGLCGSINYDENNILGKIQKNTTIGIYGEIDSNRIMSEYNLEYMEVAYKQDVKIGKAYVRSMVSGEIEDYEIEIEGVDVNSKSENKQLIIRITDERLLDITNGIVQGMSGSPIIQDGKIIGAVTHVFVKDPTMGYGIFIEEMLKN